MVQLSTWLNGAAGTRRGIWYFFFMSAQQLLMATILGFLYSFAWTTSSPGTKTLLVFTIILQLSGVIWTGWYTANDRIDGVQNFVVYVLECTATCLVLASALVADQAKSSPD